MIEKLKHKIDLKTKPIGSLGKLEDVALKIGSIQNTLSPEIKKPTMLIFAADHGLADEGVSPFPKEVTHQMVLNFLNGGAAISIFCKQNGLNLKVVDAGVDYDFPEETNIIHAKIDCGTKNILKSPAMSEALCLECMTKGKEIVSEEFTNGCNTIGFGEMGIGNTSSAALIMNKITGYSIEECTGPGTGHNNEGLRKKIEILKKASELYNPKNAHEILATYGGFEIAMMVGAMLQAKEHGMLLMVDGFISTSAFLVAHAINPSILDNAIFCHVSQERGHKLMHKYLNVEALVSLNMRLGEGSGAAVAFPIIKSGVTFLNEMASFEDAGVSNKS
ncbi:MAG: nicotinate-nucleotide--dimethylbenzimidazole phosphoribosyltransferase [Bacteroidales bacterium]|nr:nicotinate-nucleotide--dimethylbenzimidazole phosphoribosyltransferase [Bacteroidales bacterium]